MTQKIIDALKIAHAELQKRYNPNVDFYALSAELHAEYIGDLKITVAELKAIDKSEYKLIGIGTWDKDEYLLTPIMMECIADGEVLYCPLNKYYATVGKDHIGRDVLFGVTVWGFQVKDEESAVQTETTEATV